MAVYLGISAEPDKTGQPAPTSLFTDHGIQETKSKEKNKRTRLTLNQHLDYLVSASCFIYVNTPASSGFNHLDLLQNLKYHLIICHDSIWNITSDLVHNLGFRLFFDSITYIHTDDNVLTTRINVRMARILAATFCSDLSTGIFNHFEYRDDGKGTRIKICTGSFLTPMVWTLSAGLGLQLKAFGTLNFGISSARLTFLADRSVFDLPDLLEFHGVPRDRNHVFEYGLSLGLMISRTILNTVHWDFDLKLFKEYRSPADITVENNLNIRFLKFLNAGLKTRVLYDEEVNKKVQMENILSMGFFFRL
jgi:hypothetical protein